MRITNQMMTNSMLSHINNNKINLSTLENQYSSGKKIQRPSDDPIVAVRALKLRTNLTEISQYVEKNIPDAESWMTVTETALNNVNDIIKKMNTLCVQGSSDTLTVDDRTSIKTNLAQLSEQIYAEGNSQYAGRYVFSGFKTDSSLTFTEKTTDLTYSIYETFTAANISSFKSVIGDYTVDSNAANKTENDYAEAPQLHQTNRIQLSYKDTDITKTPVVEYTDADGNKNPVTITKSMNSTDDGAYEPGANEIYYLADTGELVFGDTMKNTLADAKSISVTYTKSTFSTGELKPEHYFNCSVIDSNGKTIIYEQSDSQDINYEINFSQNLKVNTEGKDAINHDIGRIVDDLQTKINNVEAVEKKISEVNKMLEDTTLSPDQVAALEKLNEQLETELSLHKSILQESFAGAITSTNGVQDQVNVAVADLGARSKRLELTKSRLEDQQVELEELKSTNEDVDLVETVIKYKSAESIYTASLSAAATVIKTSLLDFL